MNGFSHGKVEKSWLLSLPNTQGMVRFSLEICKDSPSFETKAEVALEDDSEQEPVFFVLWITDLLPAASDRDEGN